MQDTPLPTVASKRPRISDIAREAGVSVATVDRVLHGRPGVKKNTTDLIMAAANKLEYGQSLNQQRRLVKKLKFDVILPVGPNAFMDLLADGIESVAESLQIGDVSVSLHRIDRFDPQALTERIRKIGTDTDGVAVVAVENPMVREAINSIVNTGVPVITLVSDLSTSGRLSYVGIDNRAAGRTAGYLMGRFSPVTSGKVILVAGSFGLNYRDHEEREMGFQRVLTERYPNLQIVERLEGHDDFEETYERTKSALERQSDIVGIYNISAGNRGIGRALRELGLTHKITFIGHELTKYSRQYLVDGTMDAVIDQSAISEAQRALQILFDFHTKPDYVPPHEPISIQIFVPENLP